MAIRSLIPNWLRPGPAAAPVDENATEGPRSVPVNGSGSSSGTSSAPPNGKAVSQQTSSADSAALAAGQSELRARRDEIVRLEERALRDLESAQTQMREVERRSQRLDRRQDELDDVSGEAEVLRSRMLQELESVSGLSRSQAKALLIKQVEHEASHQAALTIKRIEAEAKLESERRARGILAVTMQRLAATQSVETNTYTLHLPNEEMKGRIIGKEGRNIRSLQDLTGVDIIIDETPETVVLSCFDGVRREVARLTLEKLIADGRIHPASCEKAFESSREEIDDVMIIAAEEALLEARVTGVHPELVRLLGRLRFRTSYSQNVLAHLVECSHLAALMAVELGASVEVARRAALLHDIGKAVSHDVEGTHASVGARLARRYDEVDAVTHAIEAHHNEIEPVTVEAVIVQAADGISGARPGARGDSLEQYVTRLSDLEDIAMRQEGVKKVFAMQAGREIRVMVDPEVVSDQTMAVISHEIATAIEREMQYPGQIKITVIRELRSTHHAN